MARCARTGLARRTRQHSWDEVWRIADEERVCFFFHEKPGEYGPEDIHTRINYGLEVARALADLQASGLTRDQIDTVGHLVAWVAKAARH